jgi:hypothetical protein
MPCPAPTVRQGPRRGDGRCAQRGMHEADLAAAAIMREADKRADRRELGMVL